MLSTVVTPPTKHNYCRQRRSDPEFCCSCWPAKYSQCCQSCKKWINIGDCIRKDDSSGWTHTECPIGNGTERGIPSIENGFSSVCYSDRLRISGSGMAPRALCSEFDATEDEVDPLADFNFKRPASLIGPNAYPDGQHKRAKTSHAVVLYDDDNGDNSYFGEQRRTREQIEIISYEPHRGEIVAVNAYAGCGKTTTVSMVHVVFVGVMSVQCR